MIFKILEQLFKKFTKATHNFGILLALKKFSIVTLSLIKKQPPPPSQSAPAVFPLD
jgi:hypothetical protein